MCDVCVDFAVVKVTSRIGKYVAATFLNDWYKKINSMATTHKKLGRIKHTQKKKNLFLVFLCRHRMQVVNSEGNH